MRVALVIERFEPGRGGVEAVAWQVAHGLAAAGDEVHVVARRAAPSGAVRIRPVDSFSGWQPLRVLAFSRAAARAAPRSEFDVVQSFSRTRHQDVFRAGGGSHADYMARRYGAAGRRLRRLSPRHAVLLGIERRVFRDPSQWVLCPSRFVADELARRYRIAGERLVVIPNGVDLARFHPARKEVDRPALRSALGGGDALVWLFLGSGWRRKGLDTALRALAASGPRDAVLWVAGRDDPGPWRSMATRLGVGERVRFLGHRDDPERLCAAADALFLPTRYESFGLACLEAAAAGLPVLTSAAAGAAEVLGEGGLVVRDPEDAAGFAAALAILAEPAQRQARGREARRAAEALGWESHVAALRAFYARVAARKGAGGAERPADP
jgi:UDP-glucose:(heptosyl)LPS alpha-1,3-glucosyltransferase